MDCWTPTDVQDLVVWVAESWIVEEGVCELGSVEE